MREAFISKKGEEKSKVSETFAKVELEGFSIDLFISPVDDQFKCPICTAKHCVPCCVYLFCCPGFGVMRDACETCPCGLALVSRSANNSAPSVAGHRFCECCLREALRRSNECPSCRESLSGPTSGFHALFSTRRDISNLRIQCPHAPTCDFRGSLGSLECHLAQCPLVRISCSCAVTTLIVLTSRQFWTRLRSSANSAMLGSNEFNSLITSRMFVCIVQHYAHTVR